MTCVGQPIAVVAAETEATARAAARAVVIEYEELPAVLDIDDAIAAGSFYEGWGHSLEAGDVDAAFAAAAAAGGGGGLRVLEGEIKIGGQVRARPGHWELKGGRAWTLRHLPGD